MYKLIALGSLVLRQFCISNPFEALEEGLPISIRGSAVLLTPDVLNLITEPFMHAITFGVVGLYYQTGSSPVVGSLLYLLFYCVHTFMLWLMSLTGFAIWAIIAVIVVYIGCHIALSTLFS